MKIIKTLKNSIPTDPSHITNYKDTDTFIYFLMWIRDKMRKEKKKESDITDKIIAIEWQCWEYNKEFQEFQKQREEL